MVHSYGFSGKWMAGSNRVNCGQFNGGTFYKGVGRVKANEYIYQHKEACVALRPRAKGESHYWTPGSFRIGPAERIRDPHVDMLT